jgi:hypothetical protein
MQVSMSPAKLLSLHLDIEEPTEQAALRDHEPGKVRLQAPRVIHSQDPWPAESDTKREATRVAPSRTVVAATRADRTHRKRMHLLDQSLPANLGRDCSRKPRGEISWKAKASTKLYFSDRSIQSRVSPLAKGHAILELYAPAPQNTN